MEGQNKKSILKDTTHYSIANYIAQGLGIVNSIAMRRFMGPTAMGVWSIIQVMLGYCGYASFGTTKAMARDYPFLRGKGENEKAEKLKDMVCTFAMSMSVIPAAILVGYLCLKGKHLEQPLYIGIVFLVFFLFVQRFNDLLLNLLRSDKHFWTLSQLIVVNAIGTLAITFIFVAPWGIYGLMAGTAVVTLASIGFIYKKQPYHFKFYWNNRELWNELKLGVPLVAATFLGEILKSLDKWILAKELGFYEVGLYSIAMMASSYVYSLPNMFSHIWYPNLQQEYGRTGSTEGVKNYLLSPIYTFSILCPFLSGLAIFAITLIAKVFLPKFLPGIPAMKIYLIGIFFQLLAQFAYSFLITIDKYLVNIPFAIAAIIVNLGFNLVLVRSLKLEGVAIGTVISLFVYGVGMYFYTLRRFFTTAEATISLGKTLLILAYFFSAVYLLDAFLTQGNLWILTIQKMVLFTVMGVPFLYRLEQKMKILSHLYEMFLARKKKSQEASE